MGAATLLGVAVSACQDLPTGVRPAEPPPSILTGGSPAFSRYGKGKNEAQFVCYASERQSDAPVRYRYFHFEVSFPKSARAPDGSTIIYQYRGMGDVSGADPLSAVNCRIPRTMEAVRIMNRRYRIGQPRHVDGSTPSGDLPITVQSCPESGCGLPLDRIIAYGYHSPAYGGGGSDTGHWGSSYYDDGTGTSWDPYTPDTREPCKDTADPFLDSPAVSEGFDQMWQASNPSADLAGRTEQFGWIVRTATGFRIQVIASGSFCGWDGEAAHPAEGADAIAGFIHTHPYAVGETILTCGPDGNVSGSRVYDGTASDVDRNTSVGLGQALNRGEPLSGVILDAGAIRVFKGWDPAMNECRT